MKFSRTDWHQVASIFECDLPDEEVIKQFGSVQRLKEIISHQEQQWGSDIEPMGEPPTEEENLLLDEILQDCERYDDWWTDRKGGYEVTYRYEK
jgi:hypothetical protein